MPQFPYSLGAKPDGIDPKDYTYTAARRASRAAATGKLPMVVDNRHQCGPVWDQKQVPSCVGMTMAAIGQFLFWKKEEDLTEMSGYAQYRWAQDRDGIFGNSYPGSNLRGGCKAAAKDGFCPLSEWPEQVDLADQKPARDAAKKRKLAKYVRLTSIDSVQHFIHKVGISACTVMVNDGWIDPPNGVIQPGTQTEGPHAVALVGYNMYKSVFILRNSWSTDWGIEGYAELPFSEWARNNIDNWGCYIQMNWLYPIAAAFQRLAGRFV